MTFCHQVAEGNFNGESDICNSESDMKKVKVMREQKGSYQVADKTESCANCDPFPGVHSPVHQDAGGVV